MSASDGFVLAEAAVETDRAVGLSPGVAEVEEGQRRQFVARRFDRSFLSSTSTLVPSGDATGSSPRAACGRSPAPRLQHDHQLAVGGREVVDVVAPAGPRRGRLERARRRQPPDHGLSLKMPSSTRGRRAPPADGRGKPSPFRSSRRVTTPLVRTSRDRAPSANPSHSAQSFPPTGARRCWPRSGRPATRCGRSANPGCRNRG